MELEDIPSRPSLEAVVRELIDQHGVMRVTQALSAVFGNAALAGGDKWWDLSRAQAMVGIRWREMGLGEPSYKKPIAGNTGFKPDPKAREWADLNISVEEGERIVAGISKRITKM